MKELVFLAVLGSVLVLIDGQNTTSTSTTPMTPEQDCALGSASCENCVGRGAKCLWCSSKTEKCVAYPAGSLIPHKSFCPLKDARWGVCWVNYEVLLIVMGVFAGVLLITFGCCIYCCCCKTNKARQRRQYQKEEEKLEREREERSARHAERRAERQTKMDEIRQKYGMHANAAGLTKDSNRYKKFEDEP